MIGGGRVSARTALIRISAGAGLAAVLVVTAGCSCCKSGSKGSAAMYPPAPTKESQAAMTPQAALAELRTGNARFVAGKSQVRNLPAKVRATASGQYPFAVILSCLDSRQPIEMVFDQGIGDVFSARVAGNVLNDDIVGSMEFACQAAGAKLIAVIGHSNCGAVKGAVDDVQLGSLTGLLSKIKPAMAQVPAGAQPPSSKDHDYVQKVAEANVRLAMRQIRERSPGLREMIEQGKIALVGGMYDLETGEVHFFPE
jgi:carbonic anhydrase